VQNRDDLFVHASLRLTASCENPHLHERTVAGG
jgi:hypothetical protein